MIKKIQSLDVFDKINIYMHYYITQLGLKYNFEIIDTSINGWQNRWSEPDKTFKQIAFFYLWKDINIKTFEEFYDEKNIKTIDCGEDWKENGYAQRYRIEYYGVYDWFWKFKDEFNIN